MKSNTDGHLIFHEGAKSIQLKNASIIKKNGAGSTGRPILISLYKSQFQVDQGPPHKIWHTETK